jgi:DNA-binding response OmpR family regulator
VVELAEAHGGKIEAKSEVGRGSTFSIRLPLGSDHLPAEALGPGSGHPDGIGTQFVEEALRWLPDEPHAPEEPGRPREHILVVDDNADMRSYLVHLLGSRYRVTTARDGAQALEAIRHGAPDLVLSDVMMPDVDGLELVRRIRGAGVVDLPVLLLSARAGAEAAVEGLDVGADDCLVKPFSAEELFGRVQARLAAGKARRLRQTLAQLAGSLTSATGFDEVVEEVDACLRLELDVDATSLALVEPDRALVRYWHAAEYEGASVRAITCARWTTARPRPSP